ncbi:MraY family glycosyltransferase [Ignavibacterium sp.]|uniref:glycosyltransferase family 4 protein n=1 Tax=Ignavibacterium sp. TaxID=2651167 RepID=UPI00307EF600
MLYLITLFFSFISVVYATPLFIELLRSLKLFDEPDNNRKIHTEPIPRMGGVIIYSVVILFLLFLYPSVFNIRYFLIGSLIIFLLGVIDDYKNIPWSLKFFVQSVVAVFLILFLRNHGYFNFNFGVLVLPEYLTIPILFVFIVATLNSFNLLDGLDGLVSGFSLLLSVLSFFLSYGTDNSFVTLLSVILFGVMLGFLKFNSNPAIIFLGDSGSLTLAYFSLALLFSSFAEASNHSIDLLFIGIILSVPIIDTLRVMVVRIANKRNPFLPDKNHIHHIIYSKKIRHKTTVFIILSLTLISFLIGIVYNFYSNNLGLFAFLIFSGVLLFIDKILEFIVKREYLLYYGRLFKLFPSNFAKIFKFYFLPLITFILFSFLVYLLAYKVAMNDKRFLYLLIFNLLTVGYVLINLKSKNYISDIFVLINFILLFYTTGNTDIFNKLYSVPIINYININQILALLIIPVIVFYFLYKERLSIAKNENFLNGLELIIVLLVVFSYLLIKLTELPANYTLISDVLTRSFMFYLFYKIVSNCFPKLHLPLYFSSFVFVIVVLFKALIS